MNKLRISLSCCDYDRCRAIFDGRAPIEGCDVSAVAIEPEEGFHRAFKFQEFDVCEISMSSHTLMTSRGENAYVGIPAFVSRLFRHSGIYIRTDRGIKKPSDLKGMKVGVPEYQITANVWIRGILSEFHGLEPTDVLWRGGGLEEAGREERTRLSDIPGVELLPIPSDRTLSDMLANGEIDALISARAPSCYLNKSPGVDRLFPDYPRVEREYFQQTNIFPIMHIIGIRRELAEREPWLPVSVFKSFIKAKELCMYELGQIGHLFNSLPWGVSEFESAKALMGEDYWSYGFEANRHVLETFTAYHHQQGLSKVKVDPRQLFHPASLDLSKI
jgi:4,5-dihydroxyphthalate decarboxylase